MIKGRKDSVQIHRRDSGHPPLYLLPSPSSFSSAPAAEIVPAQRRRGALHRRRVALVTWCAARTAASPSCALSSRRHRRTSAARTPRCCRGRHRCQCRCWRPRIHGLAGCGGPASTACCVARRGGAVFRDYGVSTSHRCYRPVFAISMLPGDCWSRRGVYLLVSHATRISKSAQDDDAAALGVMHLRTGVRWSSNPY